MTRDTGYTRVQVLGVSIAIGAALGLATGFVITWIIPSAVVAEVVRESHGLWLAAPGRRGQTRQDSVIRQVRNDYPNPPRGYPAGWMDSYRERWKLLLGVVDEAG